jgi:hypothetical protein
MVHNKKGLNESGSYIYSTVPSHNKAFVKWFGMIESHCNELWFESILSEILFILFALQSERPRGHHDRDCMIVWFQLPMQT